MKAIVFSVIAMFLCNFCLAADDDVSAKKEAMRLAAKMLIDELRSSAVNHPLNSDAMLSEMEKNKEAHAKKDASRETLLKNAEGDIQSWYKTESSTLLKRLDSTKPENVDSWFSNNEENDFLKCPDAVVKESLSKNFDSAFDKARENACKNQWNRLTTDVYPNENELDTIEESKLKDVLTDRLLKKQAEPVFEENKSLIETNIIPNIIQDARTQRDQQKGAVTKSSGGDKLTPEEIGKQIQSDVDEYLQAFQKERAEKKVPGKVYGIFPSVSKLIPTRSSDLAAEKFSKAIDRMKCEVSKEWVKQQITGDLKAHSEKAKSQEILASSLVGSITNQLVDAHSGKVPQELKNDFQKFLRSLLEKDEYKNAISQLIERGLSQPFDSARNELSDEQFKSSFKPLAEETWKPDTAMIDDNYNTIRIVIDEPLALPGISSSRFNDSELLEETKNKVLETEKALVTKGLSAMRNQMRIVETLAEKLETALKDSSTVATLPSEEELIKALTDSVVSDWKKDELSAAYPDIFQRAHDDIARRVKAMLPRAKEEREKEAIAKTTPQSSPKENPAAGNKEGGSGKEKSEESGGGETSEGGSGSGGGGGDGVGPGKVKPHLPDLLIDVTYKDGATLVLVKLLKDNKVQRLFHFNADSAKPNDILPKLGDMKKFFAEWLVKAQATQEDPKSEIELFVLVRVFNEDTPYGCVIALRRCLGNVLKEKGIKTIKVLWFDDFIEDPKVMPVEPEKKGMVLQA